MKTVYEKNLESLERHFPGMKKLIEEAKEELEFKLNITEEKLEELISKNDDIK